MLVAVLKREDIPGYFHTFTEAGMVNLQYALGEGHMTTHEDLFRMDYSNAACLMDCMKPNLVKVCSGFTTVCIIIDFVLP